MSLRSRARTSRRTASQRALKVGTVVTGMRRGVRRSSCACSVRARRRLGRPTSSIRRRSSGRAPIFSRSRTRWRKRCRSRCGNRSATKSRRRAAVPALRTPQAWEAIPASEANHSRASTAFWRVAACRPALARLERQSTNEFGADRRRWTRNGRRRWHCEASSRSGRCCSSRTATRRRCPKWLGCGGQRRRTRAQRLAQGRRCARACAAACAISSWRYNLTPDPAQPRKLLNDAEADLRASVTANPVQATAWNGLSYVLNAENHVSPRRSSPRSTRTIRTHISRTFTRPSGGCSRTRSS